MKLKSHNEFWSFLQNRTAANLARGLPQKSMVNSVFLLIFEIPSSSRQECWKYFLWYSSTLSTYRALFFRGSLRNFSFLVILVVPLVAYTFSFSSIQHQMVIYDIYARLIFHQFGPNCDHGVALQLQVCSEVFRPFSDDCPNQKTKNTTFPKKDPSI